MKDKMKLNEWDCAIIQVFKSCNGQNPATIKRFTEIWVERNDLPDDYIGSMEVIGYINEHFLFLARDLGLFENDYKFREFILSLDPKQNWKYLCTANGYLEKETTDFNLILLSRLDSLFSLTHVDDYLPGYRDWVVKNPIN